MLRLSITSVALAATVLSAAPRLPGQTRTDPPFVKIVGGSHKLALRPDGSVVGWGQFVRGQLGPLSAIPAAPGSLDAGGLVPQPLPARAIDVAAADSTSYALLEDGTVVAWGAGDRGQLGGGVPAPLPLLSNSTASFEYRGMERPVRVAGLAGVTAIAAGVAVMADGTVREWAGDTLHTVGGLTDVVSVSAGSGFVLALTRQGRVYSWGSNFHGALGRPPRQEASMPEPGEVTGLENIVAIAAGLGVSTALRRDGTVWVWGANWNSQFGFGERTSPPGPTHGYNLVPQQVPGLTAVEAISVSLQGRHSVARLKDGTLRAWGNNDWGQAGVGRPAGFIATPLAIRLTDVRAVFATGNQTFAIRGDGSLWAWGGGGPRQWPLPQNTRLPMALDLR